MLEVSVLLVLGRPRPIPWCWIAHDLFECDSISIPVDFIKHVRWLVPVRGERGELGAGTGKGFRKGRVGLIFLWGIVCGLGAEDCISVWIMQVRKETYLFIALMGFCCGVLRWAKCEVLQECSSEERFICERLAKVAQVGEYSDTLLQVLNGGVVVWVIERNQEIRWW